MDVRGFGAVDCVEWKYFEEKNLFEAEVINDQKKVELIILILNIIKCYFGVKIFNGAFTLTRKK